MENRVTCQLSAKETPKKVLFILFVSLVLDLLAFTLILPLLPSLLDYYRKHDSSGLLQFVDHQIMLFCDYLNIPRSFNSVLFGGLLGSLFSGLQFVSSPFLGSVSDIYGRKMVLLISMALIGIAFSIGFVLGPIIGAYFALKGQKYGEEWIHFPALVSVILMTLDILLVSTFFSETLPQDKRKASLKESVKSASDYISVVSLFKFSAVKVCNAHQLEKLKILGLSYFLYLLFFSGLEFTLTFLTHLMLNYNSMQQGKMFCFIGILMVITQSTFTRNLQPGKELLIAKMSIILIIPSFFIIGIAKSNTLLYLGLSMYSAASGIFVPCITTSVSKIGNMEKGTILGIFRALGALARAVGPILASVGFWYFGPFVTYTAGGVFMLLPYQLLRKVVHENHQD